MVFIESLDLQTWFVNVFSGTPEIFFLLSFMFISFMTAVFKMKPLTTMIMLSLFIILMTQFVGDAFLIITLILAVIFIGISIGRIVTR